MKTATKELLELKNQDARTRITRVFKRLGLEEIPLNQRQHMGGMVPMDKVAGV